MLVFRNRDLSFSILFAAMLVFVFQALLLIALSVFYPPTRFRTGITEFILDTTEYCALSSLITGLFLRDKLLNKVDKLLREFPRIINWGSTKSNDEIEKFREKWMIRAFDWKIPLCWALVACAVFFLLVRIFGVIESREPPILTSVWALDDFMAIVSLALILYVSYIISQLISRISKISIHTLNVFHIDRMGGLYVIGNLVSYRSLFLGLVLGVWLVPWLLACILTPILRARLSPELATFAVCIELLIIGAITLLPSLFFILDSWRTHKYVVGFKEQTTEGLAKDYWVLYKKVYSAAEYNRKTRHQYEKMRLVASQIEKIRGLKEWPLGPTNIAQVIITIALPFFELVVKQLIIS